MIGSSLQTLMKKLRKLRKFCRNLLIIRYWRKMWPCTNLLINLLSYMARNIKAWIIAYYSTLYKNLSNIYILANIQEIHKKNRDMILNKVLFNSSLNKIKLICLIYLWTNYKIKDNLCSNSRIILNHYLILMIKLSDFAFMFTQ